MLTHAVVEPETANQFENLIPDPRLFRSPASIPHDVQLEAESGPPRQGHPLDDVPQTLLFDKGAGKEHAQRAPGRELPRRVRDGLNIDAQWMDPDLRCRDRKSTRLNSSHGYISYAVFCLKKKKNKRHYIRT